MKTHFFNTFRSVLLVSPVLTVLWAAGCATDHDSTASGGAHSRFISDDQRRIEIGKSSPADGGISYKNPHLEKCWVADGFNFNGYDTLFIAPAKSTAKFHDDEASPHETAVKSIPIELKNILTRRGIFKDVVLEESQIKPGAPVLRLENTIVEYAKGGGAARYFVGVYGGGQPVLRIQGTMTDNGRKVFAYEARRSGVSAGAHAFGAFMKDEDIQGEDIRSFSLDMADFMSAVAGKFTPR